MTSVTVLEKKNPSQSPIYILCHIAQAQRNLGNSAIEKWYIIIIIKRFIYPSKS